MEYEIPLEHFYLSHRKLRASFQRAIRLPLLQWRRILETDIACEIIFNALQKSSGEIFLYILYLAEKNFDARIETSNRYLEVYSDKHLIRRIKLISLGLDDKWNSR